MIIPSIDDWSRTSTTKVLAEIRHRIIEAFDPWSVEEGWRTSTLCHRPQIPLISVLQLSQRREIYREIAPVNLVSSSKTPFGAKIRANALQGWGWFGHKKVQGAKPSSRRLQVFFSGRLALTRRTDGQTSKHLIGKRIRRGMSSLARSIWSQILRSIRQMFPGEWTVEMEEPITSVLFSSRSPRRWSNPPSPRAAEIFPRHPPVSVLFAAWRRIDNVFLHPPTKMSSLWSIGESCSLHFPHHSRQSTWWTLQTSLRETRRKRERVKEFFHWSSLTSFQRWRHSSWSDESLFDPIGIVRSPKLSIGSMVPVTFPSLDV